MGNRYLNQFDYTLLKGLVTLFIDVQFNATGQPTLVNFNATPSSLGPAVFGTFTAASAKGSKGGALSITRTSIGLYVLTMQDSWLRVLNVTPTWIVSAAGGPVAPLMTLKVASNPNAAGSTSGNGFDSTFKIITLNTWSAAGVLADPAATELCVITIQLMNSSSN
jgi:hypothetical protein